MSRLICLISDPKQFSGHTGSIKNALFKDDAKQIISAADDKTVRWDCNTDLIYSETCLKRMLKNWQNKVLKDRW